MFVRGWGFAEEFALGGRAVGGVAPNPVVVDERGFENGFSFVVDVVGGWPKGVVVGTG